MTTKAKQRAGEAVLASMNSSDRDRYEGATFTGEWSNPLFYLNWTPADDPCGKSLSPFDSVWCVKPLGHGGPHTDQYRQNRWSSLRQLSVVVGGWLLVVLMVLVSQ